MKQCRVLALSQTWSVCLNLEVRLPQASYVMNESLPPTLVSKTNPNLSGDS